MKNALAAAALVALLWMPGVAWAADDDESEGEAEETTEAEAKPEAKPEGSSAATGDVATVGRMTLPGGKVLINAIVEANLGSGAVGKPFSIAPDLWYGWSDKLTLGLTHSGRGQTGFLAGAGRGLCFGDEITCAIGIGEIYTTVGAEARMGLTEGNFPFALALGAIVEAFEPELVVSGKIGVVGRWQSDRIALELAPTVFAGLTQRKVADVSFNEDVFSLPVTMFVKLSPALAIAVQSGFFLTIEEAADSYVVPGAVGLTYAISPKVSFDLAFGLTALVDNNDMTGAFDGRTLTLGVGYGM
jgi:hypothetical protein